MADKIFYSYIHDKETNVGKVDPAALSAYSDSIIFDLNKRTLWHQGKQFGNAYWGSSYGENFNDFINNNASGDFSHAEGSYTNATGKCSHAEGSHTLAFSNFSHTSGLGTVAYTDAETVVGRYNEPAYDHIFTVGSGTNDENRHTAFYIDENGIAYSTGNDIYVGTAEERKGIISYINTSYNTLLDSVKSYVANTNNEIISYVTDSYNTLYDSVNSYVNTTYNKLYSYTTKLTYSYGATSYDLLFTYATNVAYDLRNEASAYMNTTYELIDDCKAYITEEVAYIAENLTSLGDVAVKSYDVTKKYYLWVGLRSELPETRYANVIYIATDDPIQGEIYSR